MAPQPLRFRLLGRPELSGTPHGEHLPFGKPLALLAYLACQDRAVPRSELAEILWPDASPKRARHSLREALSRIRRALDEDVFAGDDPVALAPDAVVLDLDELRASLRAGDLDAAVELWRGPFLEGLEIPDAPAWTRWKDQERTGLDAWFSRALVRSGEDAARGGDPTASIGWFRRALEVAPESVQAHRQLLRALLTLRRFDAGEEAWREAARALDPIGALDDLRDVREEWRDAGRRLRSGEGLVSPTVPFAGRASELSVLLEAWDHTTGGHGGTVVITGPAGVGKSRLGRELAERARGNGVPLHVSPKEGSGGQPFALLRTLVAKLRSLPGSLGTRPGADLHLDTLVEASGPEPTTTPPAVLAAAVGDLLGAVTFETPLLVVLDDLERADRGSLAV
ncbi:MAG: AAA family ATPase, partial [Gemmatimonadota bacterium]